MLPETTFSSTTRTTLIAEYAPRILPALNFFHKRCRYDTANQKGYERDTEEISGTAVGKSLPVFNTVVDEEGTAPTWAAM